MIKPVSDVGISSLGISPIRGTSKHQMTPLKSKRKTSKKDQGADVHTACSTPNRLQPGNSNSNFNSPSDSFPYSQENHPDVVWDYTSPKLPKGAKKKEIKITVDEFLKNLTHNQAPQCNTQNSNYIRLLEKWMTKQNTPVCVKKPVRTVKRDYKMRSRRVFEEIKQFMESIQQNNEDKAKENDSSMKEVAEGNNLSNTEHFNQPSSPVNKKSFLEGDSNENDSMEELWGDADNSFIVKATQHLDVSCFKYNAQCNNAEIVSTIPETIPASTSNVPQHTIQKNTDKESLNKLMLDSDNTRQTINKESLNKLMLDSDNTRQTINKDPLNNSMSDSDHQAQILLTQIMSYDWDSDSDFEDFENGFIMGDDDLSLIPDEVLSGAVDDQRKVTEKNLQTAVEKPCQSSTSNVGKSSNSENKSCEISFGCSESNRIISAADNMSEMELFNNFEDESFGDESILCKPEVLSWIDEVESKLSQTQKYTSQETSPGPKCTPEEIEKKKDEAIQRLKRNQSRNKKS